VTGTDPRAGHEAARLLQAAQEWLRTSAPHLAPVAADGVGCSCPVCRAIAGLREADPDAVARWVDSALAAAGSLATQAADLAAAGTRSAPPAERSGRPAADPQDEPGSDWGYAVDHDNDDDYDNHVDDHDLDDDLDNDDLDNDDLDSHGDRARVERDLEDPAPDQAAAGQDGPRARGVRRIPVEQAPDAVAR
jgi:hypothetical protein